MKHIEFAAPHAIEQRRAFDQIVARGREQAPLGHAADLMAGAADPLQQARDIARRTDLADQIDVADIDAQFQRRGGDQHLQIAVFEPLLGGQPVLFGHAAVVGRDMFRAQPFAQMPRDAFGHAARVDENQRGPVLHRQFGHAVVDALPYLVGHDRFQRHGRQFQRQIAGPHVADVDHGAIVAGAVAMMSYEEFSHRRQRLLRGRQADAYRPRGSQPAQRIQPFQAQ